jgi:hypothetical protein
VATAIGSAARARGYYTRREFLTAGQITHLTALAGVGMPTASVLLHVALPKSFPILDVRALESLGVSGRSSYTPAFWATYVEACRALAAEHGISLRTLDKALWQHSKERAQARRAEK